MTRIALTGVSDEFETALRGALSGIDAGDIVEVDDSAARSDIENLVADDPAVVVLGPALGEGLAFEIAGRLDRRHPGVSVVVVAAPGPDTWRNAMAAGVRGVLEPDADAVAIRSTIDQALEAATRRSGFGGSEAQRSRVITVISPKGGAGKTVFSTNLAVALAARAPRQVALVDMDLQFGDAAYAMMLTPQHTMADAVAALSDHDAATLKVFLTPHQSGVFTMCAPEEPATGEDIEPAAAADVLQLLSSEFKYLVIDTGAGLGEHTLSSLEASTDIVLISDMDVPSVRNLRKAIEVLDLLGITTQRRHFVLNRSDSRVGLTPADVATSAGMPLDLEIPSSRQVPISFNEGRPIILSYPKSPVARRIDEFASRIVGVATDRKKTGRRRR